MPSNRTTTDLSVELNPSRAVAVGIAVIAGGAAVLVWTLPCHWAVRAALSAVAIGAGLRAAATHVRGGRVVRRIRWRADGAWELERCDGVMHRCRLLPGAWVHPRLAVLRFGGDARRSVLVAADGAGADAFRRLRVRLAREGAAAVRGGEAGARARCRRARPGRGADSRG